jgi:hypothetical protein
MSLVTNVICVSLGEEQKYQEFNKWLIERTGQQLNDMSDHVGGSKSFEANFYAAAFNYLPVGNFIKEWKRIFSTARFIDDAQLFIKEQNDEKFHVYNIAKTGAS